MLDRELKTEQRVEKHENENQNDLNLNKTSGKDIPMQNRKKNVFRRDTELERKEKGEKNEKTAVKQQDLKSLEECIQIKRQEQSCGCVNRNFY